MIKMGIISTSIILGLSFIIGIIEYLFGETTVLIIILIFIILLLYYIASNECQ